MKNKTLSVLLAIFLATAAIVCLTSCDDLQIPGLPQKPPKLSAPVVTLTDNIASWEADPDADKFEISLDGTLSYVENTITTQTLSDGQTLKVRAVGDGVSYSTSDWSNSVFYTENTSDPQPTKLATPSVSISSEGLATWTAVENASGYIYRLNDGAEVSTTQTSVQLSDGQSIAVKAVGDGTNYADGDFSASKIYTAEQIDTNVTVDIFWLEGELYTENGRNGAKITVGANISDISAHFERLEIYNGQTMVLTDNEFEGFSEYCDLNSKTEYTVKMYYSSEQNNYSGRVTEAKVTTPAYDLPDVDAYSSEKNVAVGKHAIFNFTIEKYVDLKYYDITVRGYEHNDAYFAPFIVEMLDDPGLLDALREQSDKHYMRPGGYVWEAGHYMDIYLDYLLAWEHKERNGYADDRWREIASSEKQYAYELSTENGDVFVANDGDFVYNYYVVLRDFFSYTEDIRFDICMRVDLGDGAGVREIKMYDANPYFRDHSDDSYGFRLEADESVKNGYVFTETDMDYKPLYVYRLVLYQNGEFVCYVPFDSNDIQSIDMETWLSEWIEKLKCEIPDASEREMIEKLGADIVADIFNELWFEVEMGNDIVVGGDGGTTEEIIGGNKLGNHRERELLTALSGVDPDLMLILFKAQTQENKALAEFITTSDNSTIVSVLNDFREQVEITEQNAYAIYAAINEIYDVYYQLKNAYETCVREEYASREIADRVEAIPPISFKFKAGTDLAPAGNYELYILYRSIFKNYEGDATEEPLRYYPDITIKRDLKAPTNVRSTEDGRIITWDAVDGADWYVIYVNGEERFDAWSNSYEQQGELRDGDIIQIMAAGEFAYDSELSEGITFVLPKLSKPIVTVSGSTITWEPVENATKYVYTVGGEEFETRSTSIFVRENGAVVRIKAVDEYGMHRDSDIVSVTVKISSPDKEK